MSDSAELAEPLAAIAGYWDDASASFDEEPDHGLRDERTRAAWERRLAQWLPAAPADVLDAGCGTGTLASLMARAGHRVTGVDLAPGMLARAEAKLAEAGVAGRFLLGDAAAPPTGAQRFDVVLERHVAWTLLQPQAALRHWLSLLRPGGRLVLVEGRWRTQGSGAGSYVVGAGELPWDGGIGADDLASMLTPLVAEVSVEPLSGDSQLWGRPVDDERYAVIARL